MTDRSEKWLTLSRHTPRDIRPMQHQSETPAKSISELLALFMRQAAVEAIAKRADVRRDIPARSKQ
jgi:hypothetical protein